MTGIKKRLGSLLGPEGREGKAGTTAANVRFNEIERKSDNAVTRVEYIETIAGLAPGEVTDAQTANLIEQPETLTRTAFGATMRTEMTSQDSDTHRVVQDTFFTDSTISASQDNAVLGPNLLSDTGWSLGEGWTGTLETGFTHTSGTEPLVWDAESLGTGVFVVLFSLSTGVSPIQDLDVTIGDAHAPYNYSKNTSNGVGLTSTTAGDLRFTPVGSSPWTGTITDISLHRIQEDAPAATTWRDESGNLVFGLRTGAADQENVFLGNAAGRRNISGARNVALGSGSMGDNTSGHWNVAVGWDALRSNQSGSRNVAVGQRTLVNNDTGYRNVAVGQSSLVLNEDGQGNVAIGADAMLNNVSGNRNIAIGLTALGGASEGDDNVAIGRSAMQSASTNQNVGIGYFALYESEGDRNVSLGAEASRYTTTGQHLTTIGARAGVYNKEGSDNTLIGYEAGRGRGLSTGSFERVVAVGKNAARRHGDDDSGSVAIGYEALANTDGGTDNVAVGRIAGRGFTGHKTNENVLLGARAGVNLESGGDKNVLIGYGVGLTTRTGHDNILIGHDVLASSSSASHEINIGNVFKGNTDPTNRGARIEGYLEVPQLPTSRPAQTGRVWNDNGTLKVS